MAKISVFSDTQIAILDEIEEQNKVAIRWTLKTTREKDLDMAANHKKIEIEGTRFFILKKTKSRKDGLQLIQLN
ncbi:MAG TPA: hypothetical protein VEL11_01145 [Candidatus Bathyarchaeia archaeon]|nr:hypothetical protein [Candidatus Bathyarchaeia archaeon]